MVDDCEISYMRDISDDKDCYEDDVEEFKDLFGPGWHRCQEAIEHFCGFGIEIGLGSSDSLAGEDTSHGDIFLFFC